METKKSYKPSQLIGLILGIVSFIIINWFIPFQDLSSAGVGVLATLSLVASWWIFESIDPGITGLAPLVLLPMTGALTAGETASAYGNNTVFMFFGGFAIALAIERWGLHNRIALNIIKVVGTSLNRLVIGLVLASTFISMWVSNTATALMILPIASAIGGKMENLILEENPTNTGDAEKFKKSTIWAVAFGAMIGGSITLIGTPTNIALSGFAAEIANFEVPFVDFMLFESPLAIFQVIVCIVLLNYVFYRYEAKKLEKGQEFIQAEIAKLGKMSYEEKVVGVIFILTVFFWVSRTFIWMELLPGLNDTIISIIATVALFGLSSSKGGRLLDKEFVPKFPWSVILMIMGGMGIAAGFTGTDLADWLGNQLLGFLDVSLLMIIVIITGSALLLTQVAPNTATGTIVIPIAGSIAQAMGVDTFTLMTAAALGAGFANTLPSGTPLMGIIYGSGNFTMGELIKVGGVFVLCSFVGIVALVYLWLPVIF